MRKGDSTKGVKAWVTALALAVFALAPFAAEAGFIHHSTISSSGRRKLENGYVYLVNNDVTVKAGAGLSAFYMDGNATSVIYVASGKTLKLTGGNGSEMTGGGAGIEIPSSSTLIVTGGGTISATGGRGASGSNGGDGEDANVDGSGKPHDDWGRAGVGGAGGHGGGGAGAGIGGNGGSGGRGREEPRKASNWHDTNGDWQCKGYNGFSGYSGSKGNGCGTIYVLGTVNVTATGGAAGAGGGASGSNGSKDKEYWTLSYRAGGGGGGGGGGSGCAASAFGGGGGGGGAGGGGGEGSRYRTTQGYTYRSANGGHGGGGSGAVNGGGSRSDGEDGWFVGTGGDGGSGGSKGATGDGGKAYKAAAASFSGASSTSTAESHYAIEYTITFNDGARLTTSSMVKFGYPLPDGPTTHRVGYDFRGWYSGSDGSGTQYYDANGNPVVSVWTDARDMTLYPRWDANSESLETVTLYVNDTPVREGTDVNGSGWNYKASDGKIYITGDGGIYYIRGKDEDGFAQIRVRAKNCTVKVADTLEMQPGSHDAGYVPFGVDVSDTQVTFEVEENAVCNLVGGNGYPAILPGTTSSRANLIIKARGALTVTGGDNAADIGPYGGYAGSYGDVYIETYDNWFSNLRLGHGMGANNGLANDRGYSANFYSYPAGERVYSVRLSQIEPLDGGNTVTMYRQRILGVVKDTFTPDWLGDIWFWVPNGAYEWAQEPNATVASNNLWTASVSGKHIAAEFFTPLHVEINGEDIAHLSGAGWYTVYENSTDESKRATLIITNAGPHIITGYGNASIELMCDMSLTISNLMLNVASWERRSAIYLMDNVDLNLRLEDKNSLTSAARAPGILVGPSNTLTIDGDGELKVTGGEYAAGIGGSYESLDKRRNGAITINGGHILASGGKNAAGVGSAQTSSACGAITINGGVVIASGGQYAAAVGGGYTGCANVTITGGTVYPTAGSKAAAIGNGYSASGSSVNTFGFAAIYTTADKVSAAAKNAAGNSVYPISFSMGLAVCQVTNVVIDNEVKVCKDLWTDENGNLTLWLEPTGGRQCTITVTVVDENGDSVTKSWGYKVDDGGNIEFSTDVLTMDGIPVIGGKDNSGSGWSYSASSSTLVVSSGNHTIGGSSTNGTICVVVTGDGLNITLDNLTLKTPNGYLSPFVISNSCTLTLSGENTIEGTFSVNSSGTSGSGSTYTAGVEVPKGASLVIEGEGSLMASAGMCGAGIGSRGVKQNGKPLDAGSITINGGYIYATGGWGRSGGGAGIGGGVGNGVASILITGGYVYAKGANNACGIGGGWGREVTLTNGTLHVTGGTVLAERGEASKCSDFVTSDGNTIDTTDGTKSIVIDGGSVRPWNAIVTDKNPYPNPVNSNGVVLVYAVISGFGEGDTVSIVDPLWSQYNGVELVADDGGAICLWGERTNEVRSVAIESAYLSGGSSSFDVSASSNTVNKSDLGGEAADKRTIDGKDCWRVEVRALPAGQRVQVTGSVTNYTARGTVQVDYTGTTYIYLPDGEYDFTVNGYTYHAIVAGAPTVATYNVGILVNGVDIGAESGEGWSYNGSVEALTLSSASAEYVIAGTNTERRVSVYAATTGVKVRSDRLVLKAANAGPFCLTNSNSTLEFTGGTLSCGGIPATVTVSGGSFNTELMNPVARIGANSYTNAYRVTISECTRYSHVEIEDIEGLGSYDTSNLWADEAGEVHLYLPDGEYYFRVRNGGYEKEKIVIVEGMDAVALDFTPTGVYINGRDAARLRGEGWRNEDGLVSLLSATNYVIVGTNDGSAVTFRAEKNRTTLTLDNLVLTNELMLASPIAVGSGSKTQITLALSGTNILRGVELGTCGVEMEASAELTVQGDGFLKAQGGENAPGIGLAAGASGTSASLTVNSGEIVAIGGANAAGIGGGSGQDGFMVYAYGGTVAATGGEHGAGIGGGYSGGAGGGMVVTNGVVTAIGGSMGAGIGGGWKGKAGSYQQSGGTVVARGAYYGADIGQGREGYSDTSSYARIYGGSLNSASTNITKQVQDLDGNPVYCVTIPTGRPNFDVGAVMTDYDGYLLTGVKTDDEGKIYIWLPNGTYYITIGGAPYRAVVNDADTTAETWAVGVTVNGEDLALQSGAGWTYNPASHALSLKGDNCVVSGMNTEGIVYFDCTNDVSVALSNLVLTTSLSKDSPIQIASNVTVHVTLMGENALTNLWSGAPAIHVPYSATLSITSIVSYVDVPDLDNIMYYTNTVESIEEEDDGYGGVVIVTNYVDIVTVVTNYESVLTEPVLTVKGAYEAAGIGGGYLESYGTIEIAGGIVNAAGGTGGAGIGSGSLSEGLSSGELPEQGTLRISGGKVTADGGRYAAGIGGGSWHTGGTIAVSGGEVAAHGDEYGAGIGGGQRVHGYKVSISGGKVAAYGGEYGAGIGDGYNNALAASDPAQVSISGGQVTAIGGEGAAGIGAAYWDPQCAVVNITGGTVVATGGDVASGRDNPDDIGLSGFSGYSSPTKQFYPLTIKGASVHATHRTASNECVEPAPSNGTERVWCVTVETQKTNELVNVKYLNGFGDGSGIYTDENGKIYLWLPNGTYVFYVDDLPFTTTVRNADATATAWFTGVLADGVDVSFAEADGKKWAYDFGTKTLYVNGDCVISGTNTAGYVNILAGLTEEDEGGGTGTVECSFTISNLYLKATSNAKASPITVKEGTVTVCLAGTNRLDATETDSFAGLNVVQPATLAITNLEDNARLEAYSGEDAAAIGGNQNKESGVNYTTGTICIRGGRIYAQAKDSGAGIGSGYKGRNGDIYISGGQIDAFGGRYSYSSFSVWCGAGIGGGDSATGSGRSIVISGGTVRAMGGYEGSSKYAADIGTGYKGENEYSVEISGGSVSPISNVETHNFNQSESGHVYPSNGDGSRVYRAVLDGLAPDAKVEMEMPGYGVNDIYADFSGRIFLWLANGVHYYRVNGQRYAMRMTDGTATIVAIPDSYGVEVDGVDVANLTGDMWSYDVFACQLSVTNACVISGTNTDGKVNISVDATEEFALTVSNLCLKAANGSPITVLRGTNTLCLAGTNVLDATGAAGYPGLHVASMYEGVVITNLHDGAKLIAKGGANAAGIGGDNSRIAGMIEITGGIVEATGGANGAGIGGGKEYGFCTIAVRGGTVRPVAGTGSYAVGYGSDVREYFGSEKILFTGGSVAMDSTGIYARTIPVNDDGIRVYRVEISGFAPNTKVDMAIDGYGTYDIYADSEGKIYPWLRESDYIFIIGGVPHLATVTSSGAVAEPWLSGVTVDGTDVAYLNDENGKWRYTAANRTLYILSGSSPADCVTVSGTNTEDYVHVVAMDDVYFAISNLNLHATNDAPISVRSHVTVALSGDNTLDATSASGSFLPAALQMEASGYDSALSLTNLTAHASLVANGGWSAAGIGTRREVSKTIYINIYGGNITATGGGGAAAIGSGFKAWSSVVEIHGGNVTATSTGNGNYSGAGIGGGSNSDGTVYIYGGFVNATGGGTAAGIGGGSNAKGYVYISGGTVVPMPGSGSAKSVGASSGGQVCFTGGSISTVASLVNPAAVNGSNVAVWPVTVTGLKARSGITFDGLPPNYGTNGICADGAGEICLWLPNGDYVFMATDEDDTVRRYRAHVDDAAADAEDFVLKGFTVNGVDVAYLSGEGWSYDDDAVSGRITLSGRDHYELSGTLTNKFLNISNSCSIVFSNAVFNSYNVYGLRGIMNIAGTYDVSLTLTGENKVKAPTGGGIAGIMVPKDASLVIGGDGSLTADAGENAAGIGGAKQIESGSITVNGGTVTATGGNYAAGIGGGYDAGCGSITVNGGTVTATGGRQGAGIGGGAFTGGTSVGGTYGGDIVITGGVVVATGGDWAAGIGGGEQSSGGSVTVKGGKITAQGGVHGPAIGACGSAGTYGDVTILGGTIVTLTNEYSIALGRGRDTVSMGNVTILGGSIDAASYSIDPAPSNTSACVSRVAVTGLTPNAAVAFDGLPPYYGTSGIYADDSGSVYLWLPEDWTTPVTPRLLSASPRLGGASPGTTHTFSANGYRYTVTIPAGGGDVVAEHGEALRVESLVINSFIVEDGTILMNVAASPETWLAGFFNSVTVRAAATLPIPDTDETRLDMSGARRIVEPDGSTTFIIELPPSGAPSSKSMFFKAEAVDGK